MSTVRIRGGWLKIGPRNKPGHPDIGLPVEPDEPDGGDEHPDQGELPSPPPGIWPPVMPGHPIQPLPPGLTIPPGAIWPRPPGPVEGKFIVLAHIPQHGWHWIVIDPDEWPDDLEPTHPIAPGTPGQPPREPKR